MNRETHDVVIIGGGIIGVATAYFLAKEGRDVCVVDRNVVGQESSGRAAGNIGQSHRPPSDLPIAMRCVEFWKKFREESDLDFEYQQQGNLRLAMNEEHAGRLKAMVEREQAAGLNVTFLDRKETRDIVPYVSDIYLGSVHSPSDGSAEPYLATVALARAAKRAGAIIHEHREVTGIETTKGAVTGVHTSTGDITAGVVMNAAGAWSTSIAEMTGIKIPAEPRRSHIIITEQLPKFLGPVLSTDLYGYFRQAKSGNVLIGYAAKPVAGYNRHVAFDAVQIAARRAAIIIPRLRTASVIRAFTGFTTWTPDNLPIMGPVPKVKGLYIASAFCGLGFAIGPAAGEMMAELIMHGKTPVPIDAYSLDRFANLNGGSLN